MHVSFVCVFPIWYAVCAVYGDRYVVRGWQIIRDGKNMYIFSMHGHGRAGIVGGCLLGRLYVEHVCLRTSLFGRCRCTTVVGFVVGLFLVGR